MRELTVDASQDLLTSDVLLTLQLRTDNEPLLPNLRSLECEAASEAFIPFIPLFLSPGTIEITLKFAASAPTVMVASAIARLSKLCPNIQSLQLDVLPRNRVITEAASELLLGCNQDTLQRFFVNSPLNEDAHGYLHKFPKLRRLWAFIQGPTWLPPAGLPDLETIYVRWDSGHDWLQGFRGATIGKLKTVTFCSTSESQLDGFLEEFQSVALTTSIQASLSGFSFRTSRSWAPNYSSLLGFKQLTALEVEFSCRDGCSSKVDDDIITSLARAMPKLEILRLGEAPCSALTGVTLKGLVALASHCIQLSELRVHLEAKELAKATASTEPPCLSENAPTVLRASCALTNLQVGETPIEPQIVSAVALTLLQIFPRIHNVEYVDPRWESVKETIKLFKRIGGHIDHTSK